MRYKLRTLLIVLAVVPPLAAGGWFAARLAFRVRLNHPTYNDREAMRVLEREYQAGRFPVDSP